jgi:hypothetical protein
MTKDVSIGGSPQRWKVKNLVGQEIYLLSKMEQTFYVEARDKYLAEFAFTVASDLRGLDRLLMLEVQMYRAQWFLSAGCDYQYVDLDPAEEVACRRTVKECAAQIQEIQKDLGLTKAIRDKDAADSVGAYITKLKLAAKQHGIKRERELGRALELTHELFALCGAFQRSNEHERRKLGFDSAEDIVTWVMEYMAPEFNAIDEYFREHEQRFWVREL